MMQSEQRYARLQMTVDVGPALPSVAADAMQIRQVLVNLISNAADAGATAIHLQTSMPHTDRVQGLVSDNGGGIDPAISTQIFDPFFSTRADGMGMGLAICSTIISGHQGKLWSEPGIAGGSRLLFTLPLAGAAPVPDKPMPDQQGHRRDGRPAAPNHTARPPQSFP